MGWPLKKGPRLSPGLGRSQEEGGVSLRETRLGVTADHRPMASWIPWQRNEVHEGEIPPGKENILEVSFPLISDFRPFLSC